MVPTDAVVRSRHPPRASVWLGLLLWQVVWGAVQPQPSAAEDVAAGSGATRGLVYTGLPLARSDLSAGLDLTLAASGGYGVTERMATATGAQHRAQGVFAVALAPLPWLAFGLRLDGRIEAHPNDGMGAYVTAFGEPRLSVRAGYALAPDWSVGAELAAWFPGADAPSLRPAATSLEGKALAAFTRDRWTVLGLFGARWDNSAELGLDRARLRISDRITLGLSSSNALLLGLGVSHPIARAFALFGELSADALVGSAAPTFVRSPLRAAVGGRYAWSDALQLELTTVTSLSRRPKLGANQAWVPIEPRFSVLFGLRYSFEFGRPPPAPAAPPPATKPAVAPTVSPQLAAISGVVTDDHGEPLPEVRVKLHSAGADAGREVITDAQGRYSFADLPLGAAELEASAVGFAVQRWSVTIAADTSEQAARALTPAANTGSLRGLIRSFQSEPLSAHVLVRNARGKLIAEATSGSDGHVEIELAPGRYRVTIEAAGYRSYVQTIQIKGNNVSVLNADLRKQP